MCVGVWRWDKGKLGTGWDRRPPLVQRLYSLRRADQQIPSERARARRGLGSVPQQQKYHLGWLRVNTQVQDKRWGTRVSKIHRFQVQFDTPRWTPLTFSIFLELKVAVCLIIERRCPRRNSISNFTAIYRNNKTWCKIMFEPEPIRKLCFKTL